MNQKADMIGPESNGNTKNWNDFIWDCRMKLAALKNLDIHQTPDFFQLEAGYGAGQLCSTMVEHDQEAMKHHIGVISAAIVTILIERDSSVRINRPQVFEDIDQTVTPEEVLGEIISAIGSTFNPKSEIEPYSILLRLAIFCELMDIDIEECWWLATI